MLTDTSSPKSLMRNHLVAGFGLIDSNGEIPKTMHRLNEETDRLLETLWADSFSRRFDRDDTVCSDREPLLFCFKVLSGCIRVVKNLNNGRRHVIEFLLPGDIYGLDYDNAQELSVEAVTNCSISIMPLNIIERQADSDRRVARAIRMVIAMQLRAARDQIAVLGQATAKERVAHFLAMMQMRLPDCGGQCFELPMSRTDMADHLGMTIETVSRIISVLRKDGCIELTRNFVYVLNNGLENSIVGFRKH